jgi:hypothetical protein
MAKLKVTWPVITQKQLEEVVWLRKNIRLWKKRPEEMGRRMAQGAIDQYEFALAQDEKRLGEALKRGAEVEAGKLTEGVLRKPAASSRRLWRRWARGRV